MSLTYGFFLGDIDTEYDSAQFSNAFHAVFGSGITPYGTKFSVTLNGFSATLSSGYALAAGRWVENDEPFTLPVKLPDLYDDRTDALVVRADYNARKASVEALVNVDAAAIRADPSVLRNSREYSLLLYFIRVRRGASSLSPDDIVDLRSDEDLCGSITPMSDISGSVLYIYQFLTSGIDEEVARLIGLIDQSAQKADAAIKQLDAAAIAAGGAPETGELTTCITPPGPGSNWLLCDGSAVPAAYPELSELLDGTLPSITQEDARFKTYIFGGAPTEV